jgi:Co/Zn/Cd efflux system component
VLGGFASAIVPGLVALFMAYESVVRVPNPVPIRYDDAIPVAVIGLAVNLLSAWFLHGTTTTTTEILADTTTRTGTI